MNKTEIKIFENPEFGKIRTLVMNDEPWFVGKDVAEILGYVKPRNAIATHVDEEDKTRALIQGCCSNYKCKAIIINESGLYSLIFDSKLPQAKDFKHWVTAEVLPQIRKTGGYIPVNETDNDEAILSKAVKIFNSTIEQKEALLHAKDAELQKKDKLIKAQEADVIFADAVQASEGSVCIRDLAKEITKMGINIGQARLFYWLRRKGYLFKRQNRPIQKWVEKGFFELHEFLIPVRFGTKICLTTKVTGRGQHYFIDGFLSGKFKADNQSLS